MPKMINTVEFERNGRIHTLEYESSDVLNDDQLSEMNNKMVEQFSKAMSDRSTAMLKENAPRAKDIIGQASKYVGVKMGAGSLVRHAYANQYDLPASPNEQVKALGDVEEEFAMPGDVAVFKGAGGKGYHTGIYQGNGKFIHSSDGKANGGIIEDDLNAKYNSKNFIKFMRPTKEADEKYKADVSTREQRRQDNMPWYAKLAAVTTEVLKEGFLTAGVGTYSALLPLKITEPIMNAQIRLRDDWNSDANIPASQAQGFIKSATLGLAKPNYGGTNKDAELTGSIVGAAAGMAVGGGLDYAGAKALGFIAPKALALLKARGIVDKGSKVGNAIKAVTGLSTGAAKVAPELKTVTQGAMLKIKAQEACLYGIRFLAHMAKPSGIALSQAVSNVAPAINEKWEQTLTAPDGWDDYIDNVVPAPANDRGSLGMTAGDAMQQNAPLAEQGLSWNKGFKDLARQLVATPFAFAGFKADLYKHPAQAMNSMVKPFYDPMGSFNESPVGTLLMWGMVGADLGIKALDSHKVSSKAYAEAKAARAGFTLFEEQMKAGEYSKAHDTFYDVMGRVLKYRPQPQKWVDEIYNRVDAVIESKIEGARYAGKKSGGPYVVVCEDLTQAGEGATENIVNQAAKPTVEAPVSAEPTVETPAAEITSPMLKSFEGMSLENQKHIADVLDLHGYTHGVDHATASARAIIEAIPNAALINTIPDETDVDPKLWSVPLGQIEQNYSDISTQIINGTATESAIDLHRQMEVVLNSTDTPIPAPAPGASSTYGTTPTLEPVESTSQELSSDDAPGELPDEPAAEEHTPPTDNSRLSQADIDAGVGTLLDTVPLEDGQQLEVTKGRGDAVHVSQRDVDSGEIIGTKIYPTADAAKEGVAARVKLEADRKAATEKAKAKAKEEPVTPAINEEPKASEQTITDSEYSSLDNAKPITWVADHYPVESTIGDARIRLASLKSNPYTGDDRIEAAKYDNELASLTRSLDQELRRNVDATKDTITGGAERLKRAMEDMNDGSDLHYRLSAGIEKIYNAIQSADKQKDIEHTNDKLASAYMHIMQLRKKLPQLNIDILSPVIKHLDKLEDKLKDYGFSSRTYDGEVYSAVAFEGMTIKVIDYENNPDLENDIIRVKQTVAPAIYLNGKLLKSGEVVVEQNSDAAKDLTLIDDAKTPVAEDTVPAKKPKVGKPKYQSAENYGIIPTSTLEGGNTNAEIVDGDNTGLRISQDDARGESGGLSSGDGRDSTDGTIDNDALLREDGGSTPEEVSPEVVSTDGKGGDAAENASGDAIQGSDADSSDGDGGIQSVGSGGGSAPAGDTPAKRKGRAKSSKSTDVKAVPSGDYAITEEEVSGDKSIGDTTDGAKKRDLIAAINLLHQIEAEDRWATPEEQAVLVRFPGWGWTGNLLNAANVSSWASRHDEYMEIANILTDAEMKEARTATLNSHYTSPTVIQGVWDAVKRLGFKGGSILEPSAGTGLFIGLMPNKIRSSSNVVAIEKDGLTARFLKQLCQQSNTINSGYEEVSIPNDSRDLIISNVPFGNYPIYDKAFTKNRTLKALATRIHNYFFAKALQQARPGGIVAFITSHGTLDARDSVGIETRKYLQENSKLLGAIRLPNNAFLRNAGTQVTTDIIFLQKLGEGIKPGDSFTESVQIGKDAATGKPMFVNEYFVKHPDMVLGTHSMQGSMHSAAEYTVVPNGTDLDAQMNDAIDNLPRNAFKPIDKEAPVEITIHAPVVENRYTRLGRVQLDADGKVSFFEDGNLVVADPKVYKPDQLKEAKAFIKLRDAYEALIDAQFNNIDDDGLAKLQKPLLAAYEALVKNHGALHAMKKGGHIWYIDPDASTIRSLEHWDRAYKKSTGLADIFTQRVIRPEIVPTQTDSPLDALMSSLLNNGGTVKVDQVAAICSKTPEEAVEALSADGHIFFDTEHGADAAQQWVLKDEYLSGNVKAKLANAIKAADNASKVLGVTKEQLKRSVEALEAVQPKDLPITKIAMKPGAQWIPKDFIKAFVEHLFNDDRNHYEVKVSYNQLDASWSIKLPTYLKASAANTRDWGSIGRRGHELLLDILNSKPTIVMDTDENGKRYERANETKLAKASRKLIRDEWDRWLDSDIQYRNTLAKLYNATENVYVTRKHNGSHLQFPGMNPSWTMRIHQVNSVWRIICDQNSLLAHGMGTGKTATMQAACMEMRRIGLRKKPVMVVMNNTLGQIAEDFKRLYPGAKLLVYKEDGVDKAEFIGRAITGDWDCIIISHEGFKTLPLKPETINQFLEEEIEELEEFVKEQTAIDQEGSHSYRPAKSDTVKKAEKKLQNLKAKLKHSVDEATKHHAGNITYFEDMGIDHLFVDECQEFKNLPFPTRKQGFGGGTAQRAKDMHMKTRLVHAKGGGLTFSSGTPMTNSIAEMYTLQRYLAPEMLKEHNINTFDAWAQQYTDTESVFERSVSGNYQRKDRIINFSNVGELMLMYKSFADIVTPEMVPEIVMPRLTDIDGNITDEPILVFANINDDLRAYWRDRADLAHNLPPPGTPGAPSMLTITSDCRLTSVDIRTRVEGTEEDPHSPINQLVATALAEHRRPGHAEDRRTMTIFLDTGVPQSAASKKKAAVGKVKNADIDALSDLYDEVSDEADSMGGHPVVDLYADIKAKLIAGGVDPNEIAFVHDAKDDKARVDLFDKVVTGEIRILLGSRAKMGVGSNFQQRMSAQIQIGPPWRPDQVLQAVARMVRPGNLFADNGVRLYHIVTPDSFDSFMWGVIARKSRTIKQIESGDESIREVKDIGGDSHEYSMDLIDASASGRPELMRLGKARSELDDLTSERSGFDQNQRQIGYDIDNKERNHTITKDTLKNINKEVEYRDSHAPAADASFSAKVGNVVYTNRQEAMKAARDLAMNGRGGMSRPVSKDYKGYIVTAERTEPESGRTLFVDGQPVKEKLVAVEFHVVNPIAYKSIGRFSVLDSEATASWERFDNVIKALDTRLSDSQKRFDAEETDIARLKKIVDRTWEKQGQIDELTAEIAALVESVGTALIGSNTAWGQLSAPKPVEDDFGKDVNIDEADSGDEYSLSQQTPKNEPKPRTTPRAGNRVANQQVVTELQKVINTPINRGYMGIVSRTVAGMFRKAYNTIRSRNLADVDGIAHEVGHTLNKRFGWSLARTMEHRYFTGELENLGDPEREGSMSSWEEGDSLEKKRSEGVGELVRLWITDYAAAVEEAPEATKALEAKFADAKILDKMVHVRQMYEDHIENRGAVEKLISQTDFTGSMRDDLETGHSNLTLLQKANTHVVDNAAPIRYLLERVHKMMHERLLPSKNGYMLFRNSRGAAGKAETLIKGADGVRGLHEIMKGSGDKTKHFTHFSAYAMALRMRDLNNAGRATGLFDRDEIDEIIAELQSPAFDAAADEMRDLVSKIMDIENNFHTPESMAKWEDDFYVPLMRVYGSGVGKGSRMARGKAKRMANQRVTTKQYKGTSKLAYVPFLDVLTKRIYDSVQAQMLNDAFLATVDSVITAGDDRGTIEPISAPVGMETPLSVLTMALKQQGMSSADIDAYIEENFPEDFADAVHWIKTYSLTPTMAGDGIAMGMRNGLPAFYQINDDYVYNALVGMTPQSRDLTTQVLAIPANMVRFGVTTAPLFALYSNLIRDTLDVFLIGKGRMVPLWNVISVLKETLKGGPDVTNWLIQGGDNSGNKSLDERNIRQKSDAISHSSHGMEKWAQFKELMNLYRNASESVNRIAMYESVLKETKREQAKGNPKYKGWSEEDHQINATYESKDTADFSERGEKLGTATATIPFFRAGLNSTAKLTHEATVGIKDLFDKTLPLKIRYKRLSRMLAAGAAVMVVSIMVYLKNQNDPDYWALPDRERDTYIHFKLPNGNFLRVPKAHLMGWFWTTLPEHIIRKLTGEPEAFQSTLQSFEDATFNSPVPTAISVLTDLAGNSKQGTGAPITSPYKISGRGEVLPEDQYNAATSETARMIGKGIHKSPAKIEYAIGQLGASTGSDALRIADLLLYKASQVPGIKGHLNVKAPVKDANPLSRLTTHPNTYTDLEIKWRNRLDKVRVTWNSVKATTNANDPNALKDANAQAQDHGFKNAMDLQRQYELLASVEKDVFALTSRYHDQTSAEDKRKTSRMIDNLCVTALRASGQDYNRPMFGKR